MSKAPGLGFNMQPSGPPPGYPPYPAPQQQQAYPNQPYHASHQPFPAPIQQQPQQHYGQAPMWLNPNFQNYLMNAASFHVKQKVELAEVLLGWETGNKYSVYDQSGHKIFYVGEDSNLCARQCCSAGRPFTLTVKDTLGQNVLVMERELDCSCFCGLVCPDKLQISTPQGQLLGSVVEEFDLLYPTFSIRNAIGKTVLTLKGPICPLACGGSIVFRVLNLQGVSVGTISKEWAGLIREIFTDADNFSMSFPPDMDLAIKAVLLGALFLIDFEYFEKGGQGGQGGRRLFG